jgi:hypothetical protein
MGWGLPVAKLGWLPLVGVAPPVAPKQLLHREARPDVSKTTQLLDPK